MKIVDFFGIWPMCLLFFSYQESRFPASTAVATSVNPASQTKVKQAEDAHFQRGMYNTEVGLYDYAIAKFQEVLKLHPAHSAAHCRMGVVYCLKNMLNEAADAYQHALTVPAAGNSHEVVNLYLRIVYKAKENLRKQSTHARKLFN